LLRFKGKSKIGIKEIFHSFIGNSWYNAYFLRYKSKEWITRIEGKNLHIFGTIDILVK
jgi:hypothetical protein